MRTGRAAVFAAVSVLLASLGHVLMSGTPVPAWSAAAALAAVFGLARPLGARERGPLLVTGLTVGVQAALHTLFALGQAAAGSGTSAGGGLADQWARLLLCTSHPVSPAETVRMAQAAGLGDLAGMPGMTGMPGTAGMSGMAGMPGTAVGAHAHQLGTVTAGPAQHAGGGMTGMLAAHLLAALLMGLWLSAGERGAFRLGRAVTARLLAPLLLLLRLACPPHRPRLRPVRAGSAQRLRQLLLVHALTSRGPPAGIAVA